MTKEEAANSICSIIKTKGEDGKSMMLGALRMFYERKHGSAEGFSEGLDYAQEQGRVETSTAQVWLK